MYSLDDDVRNEQTQNSGDQFADGVKFKRMTCDDGGEVRFRILPAHNPDSAQLDQATGKISIDPNSWVTFRHADGRLMPWARKINIAPFVGHGGKGTIGVRRSIVSLTSYSNDNSVYCPLVHLLQTVRQEQATWGYLTKDKVADDGRTVIESQALSPRLSMQLLANIVDIGNVGEGVQLGVFSKSAYDCLLSQEKGLAYQRNVSATQEMIQSNPMMQWACGDLTDPVNGPALVLFKEQQSSRSRSFRGYVINYLTSPQGVVRMPVTELLPSRYNLLDLESIMPKPTEEDIVNTLVEVLNGVSPTGEHEYLLLKHVFGNQFKIPDPPAKAFSTGLGSAPAQTQNAATGYTPANQPANQVPVQPANPPANQVPVQPANQPANQVPDPTAAGEAPAATGAQQPIPGMGTEQFNREDFLAQLKKDAEGK